MRFFLAALQQGNLEVAHAFLDAPEGSWVSPDNKQRGRDAYARRATPEAYERLQSFVIVRDQMEGLAEQAGQWLITLGADLKAVAKNSGSHRRYRARG
jgi:hypothetical protein